MSAIAIFQKLLLGRELGFREKRSVPGTRHQISTIKRVLVGEIFAVAGTDDLRTRAWASPSESIRAAMGVSVMTLTLLHQIGYLFG
jgi:hypothetical protein